MSRPGPAGRAGGAAAALALALAGCPGPPPPPPPPPGPATPGGAGGGPPAGGGDEAAPPAQPGAGEAPPRPEDGPVTEITVTPPAVSGDRREVRWGGLIAFSSALRLGLAGFDAPASGPVRARARVLVGPMEVPCDVEEGEAFPLGPGVGVLDVVSPDDRRALFRWLVAPPAGAPWESVLAPRPAEGGALALRTAALTRIQPEPPPGADAPLARALVGLWISVSHAVARPRPDGTTAPAVTIQVYPADYDQRDEQPYDRHVDVAEGAVVAGPLARFTLRRIVPTDRASRRWGHVELAPAP